MRQDPHIRRAQKGNWVWVHAGRTKVAGQIIAAHPSEGGFDNDEYTVRLKDGTEIRALGRELRRAREPKSVRNADWHRKQSKK